MNMAQFSNLLIKVAGILVITFSLIQIPEYLYLFQGSGEYQIGLFITTFILPTILPIIIGIFMFMKHDKITNQFVIKEVENNQTIKEENNDRIEAMLLTTLGYYLLFISFSDIVYNLSNQLYSSNSFEELTGQIIPFTRIFLEPNFVTSIVELIISGVLILKANKIVAFTNKIRKIK